MDSDHSFKKVDEQFLRRIWNTATPATPLDPDLYRLDNYFRPMKFTEYGNRNSKHGWEVDHILPVSLGGTDHPSNLQALNWKSNLIKSNK